MSTKTKAAKTKAIKPSKDERALAVLEQKAKAGLRGFRDTMLALMEIHRRGLYRLVCDDWRDYLKRRFSEWGEKRRVNQLCAAFAVFANIAEVGTVVPTSEAQLRPLVGAPAEVQRAAWAAASSLDDDPDARVVEETLERLADESAEERLQKIQAEEKSARAEASADDGMREALRQGVRLLDRAKRVFSRIGPPAEVVIELVERAVVEAGMVSV